MDLDLIQNVLHATIRTGTPLLLVALGETISEKSGMLNLGQEGMMLLGAVTGFITAVTTGSLLLGVLAALLAGVLASLIFGFLTINLTANQVASGLALTIFGTGLSTFIGADYLGESLTGLQPIVIPFLADIPFFGKLLFQHDILVYFSLIIFAVSIWLFASRSRWGLIIKAVGENPEVAHSVGLPVNKTRYFAVIFGGAMAGLAGGYLSLAYTPLWSAGMTSGKGWIALAIVVFASWLPQRLMIGAYLFGFVSILDLVMQSSGYSVSTHLLAMMPYLITIIVFVLLSQLDSSGRLNAPASLGKPFRPEH